MEHKKKCANEQQGEKLSAIFYLKNISARCNEQNKANPPKKMNLSHNDLKNLCQKFLQKTLSIKSLNNWLLDLVLHQSRMKSRKASCE